MKIKYILSDLDGVIRKFPTERDSSIEERFKLPLGTLFKVAFGNKDLLDKAVCGHITDEKWRSEIEQVLSLSCGKETAILAMKEWSKFSGVIDFDYLNFLELQFPKVPIAILTNGTTRLQSDLNKLGVENRFCVIFNSAEVGFCKPDKRIFEHVLKNLACEASEVLFVDDSSSHIQVAQEMGFQAHYYRSLSEFEAWLKRGC